MAPENPAVVQSRGGHLIAGLALGIVVLASPSTSAQDPITKQNLLERIERQERELEDLRNLVRQQADQSEQERQRQEAETQMVLEELEDLSGRVEGGAEGEQWYDRITLGGYGEHHFNFQEGRGGNSSDIHRFVLYLGVEFSEWLQLHSETEIEHAFVNDSDGELSIEQLFADASLHEAFNLRAGRFLAPLGIVNQFHEPTSFNGVERPNVDKFIIPTTWSVDGAGIHGQPFESLRYQGYVVAGLDGSKFDSVNGVRKGRIKESPSLNEVSYTGRIDWYPFVGLDVETEQSLRFGVSAFHGGVDNGNQGKDPGVRGDLTLVAADTEYTIGDLDLRGVLAYSWLADARNLNDSLRDPATGIDPGIGKNTQGWYVEAGYHVLPDSLKSGKLEQSDVVIFARYESYDTQHKRPSNATRDPRADREDITIGLTFFLTPQFVVKTDYQFLDDKASGGKNNQFNIGFGYRF